MDAEHRRHFVQNDLSVEELVEELDRRLSAQGFEPEKGGVKIVVDYLQNGWSVLALPPEMADQYDGVIGSGPSLHHLAGELRRRLMEAETECDGCEQKKPGCVSVGEEVLCADCLLARSTAFGDEVKSLISSWREGAERATEPGEVTALEAAADELEERFDPTRTSEETDNVSPCKNPPSSR